MRILSWIMLLATPALSFGFDANKELTRISEKYCKRNVEAACEQLACLKDSSKCPKPDKNSAEKKSVDAQMEHVLKSCEETDLQCITSVISKKGEELSQDLEPELEKEKENCAKGNQTACWTVEQSEFNLKLIKAMTSHE